MATRPEKRSEWVEQYAAAFAGVPFVREFVFPNPQYTKKRIQKEVCDLLVALGDRALVAQMKSQEDPAARDPAKLPGWIVKNACDAAEQLSGTLRTIGSTDFWCVHPRRGRVEFKGGELRTLYGLVLIECGTAGLQLPDDLHLSAHGVEIHFFDTSDFLNVVMQLRSFKGLESYLLARARLGEDVRRRIGGEKVILEYYLLHGEAFDGWPTYADAARAADQERGARDDLFREKQHRDIPATFIEYVADALATRLPTYAEGLDENTLACFDADEERKRYLLMQEVLADLSLVARRQLGGGMLEAFGPPGAKKPSKVVYRAMYLDELPEFVFVAVSTEGLERRLVINCAFALMGGALAHFRCRDGMVIADRNGEGFEIALVRGYTPTEADIRTGEERFANLRIHHRAERIV